MRTKQIITFLLTLFLTFVLFSNHIYGLADNSDEADIRSALESNTDAETAFDLISEFNDGRHQTPGRNASNAQRNTFGYVLSRIFTPQYMNNAATGTLAGRRSERQLNDPRRFNREGRYVGVGNGGYTCGINLPQNLTNHNCGIPNFATELIQGVVSIFGTQGVEGAERSPARPVFGLGIPSSVGESGVPVNPLLRNRTYTALELFGYNLRFTTYSGEWDRISVSTPARMLSNFGFMDNIRATGNALLQSISGGIVAGINNLSWNPVLWVTSVVEGASTGGLNAILDTSDLNVIATRGWIRNHDFHRTLYGVYVSTTRDLIVEGEVEFFRQLGQAVGRYTDVSPEHQAALALNGAPNFVYDPHLRRPEHFAYDEFQHTVTANARTPSRVIDANNTQSTHHFREFISATHLRNNYRWTVWREDEEGNRTSTVENSCPANVPTRDCHRFIFERVYTIREEIIYNRKVERETQFEEFMDLPATRNRLNAGANAGFDCSDSSEETLVQCWDQGWQRHMDETLHGNNELLTRAFDVSMDEWLYDNPQYNPNIAISRYICADDNGNPIRDANGRRMRVYLQETESSPIVRNPNCRIYRPTIRGGLFGTGFEDLSPEQMDSRRTAFDSDVVANAGGSMFSRFFMGINSLSAQTTNILLGISFDPVLESLGILTLASVIIESLRDTIFYPLAILASSIAAVLIIGDTLKNMAFLRGLKRIAVTVLTFVGLIILLHDPVALVTFVDRAPNYIDSAIITVILDADSTQMCAASGSGLSDGVRIAQCNIWQMMVFTPWVHAQWGTSHMQLYANGFEPDVIGNRNISSFNNRNQNLVGNAAVYMGGGVTQNNWALYQLDVMTSGTITDTDPSQPLGITDPNIYRLVDLQAGPNNGALSDDRFFENWSGQVDGRGFVVFLSALNSVFGAITISAIAIRRIALSLIMIIMIIFLPVMGLFGVMFPDQRLFKSYLAKLATVFVKRTMITFFLMLLLFVVNTAVSETANANFFNLSAMTFILILVFKLSSKAILAMTNIVPGASSELDGFAPFSGSLRQTFSPVAKVIPTHYREMMARKTAGVMGHKKGAAAHAAAAIVSNASERRRFNRFKAETERANVNTTPPLNLEQPLNSAKINENGVLDFSFYQSDTSFNSESEFKNLQMLSGVSYSLSVKGQQLAEAGSDGNGFVSFVDIPMHDVYTLKVTNMPTGFTPPGGHWEITVQNGSISKLEAQGSRIANFKTFNSGSEVVLVIGVSIDKALPDGIRPNRVSIREEMRRGGDRISERNYKMELNNQLRNGKGVFSAKRNAATIVRQANIGQLEGSDNIYREELKEITYRDNPDFDKNHDEVDFNRQSTRVLREVRNNVENKRSSAKELADLHSEETEISVETETREE